MGDFGEKMKARAAGDAVPCKGFHQARECITRFFAGSSVPGGPKLRLAALSNQSSMRRCSLEER